MNKDEIDRKLDMLRQTADWLSVDVFKIRKEVSDKDGKELRASTTFQRLSKGLGSKIGFELRECKRLLRELVRRD